MKSFQKNIIYLLVLFASLKQYGQNNSHLVVDVNTAKKTLVIQQEIVFFNQSQERGSTTILGITDTGKLPFVWKRTEKNPDLIVVDLKEKLAPSQKITLHLSYIIKVPSNKFTKYGYGDNDRMNLKNWFITPSRYENHAFVTYNNNNLDDIANSFFDIDIELKIPKNLEVTSDLNTVKKSQTENYCIHELSGKNRTDFSLFLESKSSFYSYKNSSIEVVTNLKDSKLNDIQKAIIVDRVVNFTTNFIGKYPHEKITVSQADYERNPFYGLNQLPSFISPFSAVFIFEIIFLKTYLNNYIKSSL